MNDLSAADREFLAAFLLRYFPASPAVPIAADEQRLIDDIVQYVETRFSRMTYILGLAIDFAILAQRLSNVDTEAKSARPTFTAEDIFARYSRVTERAGKTANTLTLRFDNAEEGIRNIEESVVQIFHQLNRSGYPSAYVYNTGQWQKNTDLLVMCFRLSESARFALCMRLFDYGLTHLPRNQFVGRPVNRIRLFEHIIEHYPRAGVKENGGLTFQAIAYAYIATDRPHLSIIADKVRTGSARQKRFGDIDCYRGLDIELSVEVKDMIISANNYNRELSGFVNNVRNAGILGMVIVHDVTDEANELLKSLSVVVIKGSYVLEAAKTWDWPKQDNAVHAMLHYIAHIEQNPNAVSRLLAFISDVDSSHDSLVYFASEP